MLFRSEEEEEEEERVTLCRLRRIVEYLGRCYKRYQGLDRAGHVLFDGDNPYYHTHRYNYYNHYKSRVTASTCLHLHLRKCTQKFLTNQSVLEVAKCPITSPIINPQAYPITITFQSNPSTIDDSCLVS